MKFKNFVSPHVHPSSLDTGSSPESFIKRVLELETGAICNTDHGSLSLVPKLNKMAKKAGLIHIPGIEGYFRDDNDKILISNEIERDEEQTFRSYWKYSHITVHAADADSYETVVKRLSRANKRAEHHGSEIKPLWDWSDLEEMLATNVTVGSGCLIGMVIRHLTMYQNHDIAEQYFARLKSLARPGNFYCEIFPHKCDSKYDSAVHIVYEDGSEEKLKAWKTIRTDLPDNKGKIKLEYLLRRKKHERNVTVYGVMENRVVVERTPKKVKSMEAVEGLILNECSPYSPDGDYQKSANLFILEMSKKYDIPILISDDAHLAYPEHKIVQDIRVQTSGDWKFTNSHHLFTSDEAYEHFRATLGIEPGQFEEWVDNSKQWADKFKGFSFKKRASLPTKFYPEDTLKYTLELIEQHGRIDWDNPKYVERLKSELTLLHKNGKMDLLPYFFPIEESNRFYEKEVGKLAGPGRGSAAGLLLSYYLGITHVDPIKYGLSQDRFLTLDRILQGKLPDIDSDYPDREPLLDPENGWLKKRFGDHYIPISTDTGLKIRSAVLDVARVKCNGEVPDEISKLTKQFINAPQGATDVQNLYGYEGSDGEHVKGTLEEGHERTDHKLLEYIQKYSEHWDIVKMCLGLIRGRSRHASASLITGEPVGNFIPITQVSKIDVTQYNAEACESVGAIKYDFLGINSLGDIDMALKIIRKAAKIEEKDTTINGKRVAWVQVLPFKGQLYDIWDLPEEKEVYQGICMGKTETVFQLDTPVALNWLRQFRFIKSNGNPGLDSIEALAAFTALDRPGALDYYVKGDDGKDKHNMMVEYARRVKGEPAMGTNPKVDRLLPDTMGIMCFQENLSHIFKTIGNTTGMEAENFRVHTSKKMVLEVIKDKEIFMKGAIPMLGLEQAEEVWQSMETWSRYGFNKSHAVCYAKIGYACAFLKQFYPLEWWTGVLKNATKNEVDIKFWKHCGHLLEMPEITKSGLDFEIEGDKIRAPIKLLNGIGPKAHENLLAGRPYNNIYDLCKYIKKSGFTNSLHRGVMYKLIISGVLDSLFGDVSLTRKLSLYEQALWENSDKKSRNSESVKAEFLDLNTLQTFQFRKQVLPIYTFNLLHEFIRLNVPGISKEQNEETYNFKDIPIISSDELNAFETMKGWAQDKVGVVVPAYVVKDERKNYIKNGKTHTRQILQLDIEGVRKEYIRWPGKDGKLPVSKNQTGAVGLITLKRYTEDRPFTVDSFEVLQEPLEIG